jgi:hypothetical protein
MINGANVQFLPPDDPRHRPEGAPDVVVNNTERSLRQMDLIPMLNYSLNATLPFARFRHNVHVEIQFSREQLQQAARHMKKRALWGDGYYTADSDMFCALVHQGYLPMRSLEPSYAWPENMRELHCIVQLLPSKEKYEGCSRNGIRSRSWGSACLGYSFTIVRCWMAVLLAVQPAVVRSSSNVAASQSTAAVISVPAPALGGSSYLAQVQGNRSEAIDVELDPLPSGTQADGAKPFFVLSHFDHRISTRQLTYSSVTGRRRNNSEIATVLFNLANEPWMKYNPSSVADCGFAAEQYTVSRFHSEVLYLESNTYASIALICTVVSSSWTHVVAGQMCISLWEVQWQVVCQSIHCETVNISCRDRYEVSMVKEAGTNEDREPACLAFCKCRDILPEDMLMERGVPLPAQDKDIICSRASWEALEVLCFPSRF